MDVRELRELLSTYPDNMEVMILDGFNGSGYPREINLTPGEQVVTKEDADECCDCEGFVGQTVVVMGYGCY